MRILRASSMPLGFICPAALQPSVLPIREEHDAADVGTVTHEAVRPLAEKGAVDWDGLPALCLERGVSLDEVRMLCALATKLWHQVKDSFSGARTEVELTTEIAPGVTLSGHVDLLSTARTVARAADWKSGRKDADYGDQMRAYGALVLLDNPWLTEVTVTVLWIREQEIENYTMTRHQALTWVDELLCSVVEWDGVYHTGKHCDHCPRNHECAAANALVRRDVAAIADKELLGLAETALASMSGDEIVELHRKAETVAKYADRVHEAIKAHIVENGDIVGKGVRLSVVTETRRELNTLEAWPVLEKAGFQDEDFAKCINLRITQVEKCIAAKAGKGNGAAAMRDITEKLKSAGAVLTNERRKLAQKRA